MLRQGCSWALRWPGLHCHWRSSSSSSRLPASRAAPLQPHLLSQLSAATAARTTYTRSGRRPPSHRRRSATMLRLVPGELLRLRRRRRRRPRRNRAISRSTRAIITTLAGWTGRRGRPRSRRPTATSASATRERTRRPAAPRSLSPAATAAAQVRRPASSNSHSRNSRVTSPRAKSASSASTPGGRITIDDECLCVV